MNESYPAPDAAQWNVPYKDRSVGLIIFGILTIILGCVFGSFVLLIPITQAMVPQESRVPVGSLIPSLISYVLLGGALVWLGIGSIMARRWARALLLIFSWTWLAVGVVEMIALVVIMPKAMMHVPTPAGQPALPSGAAAVMLVIMFVIFAVIFILMPAAWTFFYHSRHVKAACDARDPVARWTDACPLPVLALCCLGWLCVPMLLLTPLGGHIVAPFFGLLLTGIPAGLMFWVLAAGWGIGCWLMYRLNVAGWWLVMAAFVAGMISSVVTFSLHDMTEMYKLMDYPQAQIDAIQKMGIFEGHTMVWLMVFFSVPFLGYLIFLRRYFSQKA
jgi:hypothetical protein